jgi:hypothetical protein
MFRRKLSLRGDRDFGAHVVLVAQRRADDRTFDHHFLAQQRALRVGALHGTDRLAVGVVGLGLVAVGKVGQFTTGEHEQGREQQQTSGHRKHRE